MAFIDEFLMGFTTEAHKYFGAHFVKAKGRRKAHVVFRLYAPGASDVSLVGDFNSWNDQKHKMKKIDYRGVWEIKINELENYMNYKYKFRNAQGHTVEKSDPYAFFSEEPPGSASRLFDIEGFVWHDEEYLKTRSRGHDEPISIYEIHLGSWKGKENGRTLSYEEIADHLIPYVLDHGFTHVEIMPILQHPFAGSWGYQATGFYSVDSRYGNPFQLMSFVDRLHQAGIGVILDFVPVHFANDYFGLIEFDGTKMFEYSDPEHTFSQWGSPQFDLGKDPVRSFLISAIFYFLEYFHFDGIRIDAVSNIVYWHGNSQRGENHGGIEFLKRLNGKVHHEFPTVMMIAEDSTAFSGTTRDVEHGGLGFDYKWDLGWMNDTLKYYSKDPIYKKYDHNLLTFSMHYFFSENFMLPLSHDEVVHGKGTIINKMWGNYDQKFALIRNLYTYQFAHPGKKLNFMGNEIASFDEWDETKSLPWELKSFPKHDSVSRLIRDLNLIYKAEKAMHVAEYNAINFVWLMVNNRDQSVFAFERRYQDEVLVFVFNMTQNFYEEYDIGVFKEGEYTEIFNSDKDVYGGYNQYNGLPLLTRKGPGPELKPHIVTIKLGSNAALILKKTK
ncbi:MAG TPA: 1,4-alpha-glucan branching protein GlgB [Bacilli bacterium]|nr:1,4-alpha-glucan branching protein GlgB [Bacilli bacterium]